MGCEWERREPLGVYISFALIHPPTPQVNQWLNLLAEASEEDSEED